MSNNADRYLMLGKEIEAQKVKIKKLRDEQQNILDHTKIPDENQKRLDDVKASPSPGALPEKAPPPGAATPP